MDNSDSTILIQPHEHHVILHTSHCAKDKLSLFRPSLLAVKHAHPRTSRMRDLMRAFPPVGSTISLEQTRHLTLVDAFPYTICSFLHFGQRTFMNLAVVSLIAIVSLL